jgi:outer membrane protein OmpA-like peptidoglycan-associated protein
MENRKLILTIALLITFFQSRGQILDRLGKKVQKSAERTVERRVEKETEKKTDEALDEVFEGNKSGKNRSSTLNDQQDSLPENQNQHNSSGQGAQNNSLHGTEIVSGSTFFPNGEVLFEERFSEDAQGDFPANWETTSGGEIIFVDNQKALRFYSNSLCLANTGALPVNYALEFDLTTANLAYDGLSGSEFRVQFTNENKLNKDLRQRSEFHFSLWQGSSTANRIHVENFGADNRISNNINFNMNEKFNRTVHFTVVVNGKRMRVYVDNEKVIDLPSFLQNNVGRYVQFYLRGTEASRNHIAAIANIKILEEGEDIRSLILKGGFSTTKILFDTGSDQIKTNSYAFLDKVGKALESDLTLKVMIIGHTDSDGDSQANQRLSQKRAEAVKDYVLSHFSIPDYNLQTEGKGESAPVDDNSTEEGKTKNRRVEFKKI